eukprot:snap_masked-scaffold_23-processed-gene-0.25-mRNA-1 protein AED:1.00 eAED:1.00 QI:0/0/0/0/1/1/2/0/144
MFSVVTSGIAFVWVIHPYEQLFRSLVIELGYKIVDIFIWVKVSDQGSLLSSNGPYLNRAKETCLMIAVSGVSSQRREQSRKLDKLYLRIERAFSQKAIFCGFFGRYWNAGKRWLTIGNEIPASFDMEVFESRYLDFSGNVRNNT